MAAAGHTASRNNFRQTPRPTAYAQHGIAHGSALSVFKLFLMNPCYMSIQRYTMLHRKSENNDLYFDRSSFWHNLAPVGHRSESALSTVLFNSNYRWHNPSVKILEIELLPNNNGYFCIGDTVLVKPAQA